MSHLALSPIGTELLDDPAADPTQAAESLRNIARANRWFGNRAALRRGLGRLLKDVPAGRQLTLLDIGTGAGDLPGVAVQWARTRRLELRPVGLERSPVAASLASAAGVPTIVACAGAPPLRDRSVDLVLVSQVVHHLAPEAAIALFRRCDQLARHGVIVLDLHRAFGAQAAFAVGARLLRFDAATRHDGLVSIRRGYTTGELQRLLETAGIAATVESRPPYRLLATWRTGIG